MTLYRLFLSSLVALSITTSIAGSALACEGPATLLNEDFQFVDDTWGSNASMTIGNGKASLTSEKNAGRTNLYGAVKFGDSDICTTIIVPAAFDIKSPSLASAALIFWAKDNANYYCLTLDVAGQGTVFQMIDGVWSVVVAARKIEGMSMLPGARHQLRVTLKDNTAVMMIDDQRFAGIRGRIPQGFQGSVGLYAQSETNRVITWEFASLKVTDLPK